jgi:hypothetical protein
VSRLCGEIDGMTKQSELDGEADPIGIPTAFRHQLRRRQLTTQRRIARDMIGRFEVETVYSIASPAVRNQAAVAGGPDS